MSPLEIIGIVIACLLAIPLILPLLIGLFGVILLGVVGVAAYLANKL